MFRRGEGDGSVEERRRDGGDAAGDQTQCHEIGSSVEMVDDLLDDLVGEVVQPARPARGRHGA